MRSSASDYIVVDLRDKPMAKDSTVLNLLMRGGAVCVTFTPALESAQYDQLHNLVGEIDSLEHLSETLQKLAQQWQRHLQIDPC